MRHSPHSHPTTRAHTCGFTLVEVLAATITGAVVLGLVYAILSAGHTSRNTAQTYAHAHTSIRGATTTIRNDLHTTSANSINHDGTLPTPTTGNPGFRLTRPDNTTITYELIGTTLHRTTHTTTRPIATHIRNITAHGDPNARTITIELQAIDSPYTFELTQYLRQQ